MDKLQLLPSKWTKYCSTPRILVLNEGTSTSAWRCLLSGEYCYDSLSQIWFPLRSRRGWEKKKRHGWVCSEVRWDGLICFMCQQKRLHSKVRHDYSGIKTLEFIGKDGSPTFSHGVCHSEFSPGPALCRFLDGLQRKSELQISINTSLQLS